MCLLLSILAFNSPIAFPGFNPLGHVLVHTLATMDENENIKLSTRDVIMTTLTNDVETVPLAKRVY